MRVVVVFDYWGFPRGGNNVLTDNKFKNTLPKNSHPDLIIDHIILVSLMILNIDTHPYTGLLKDRWDWQRF